MKEPPVYTTLFIHSLREPFIVTRSLPATVYRRDDGSFEAVFKPAGERCRGDSVITAVAALRDAIAEALEDLTGRDPDALNAPAQQRLEAYRRFVRRRPPARG